MVWRISMIKLIVTDMDGTLLNENKEVSPEYWPLFRQLKERDILFSVASGRQYYSLRKTFEPICNDTLFIAENGAVIFYKDEMIHVDAMEREKVNEILLQIRSIKGVSVILCGINSAYIELSTPENIIAHAAPNYDRLEVVDDFSKVDDEFVKIAICDLRGAEKHTLPILQEYSDQFQVVLSGNYWVDMMSFTTNKGTALAKVYEYFSIEPHETMAFGDYLNDLDLLSAVEHSYAMANAHPEIKVIAKYEAPSNIENGVAKVLQKFLDAF